MKVTILGSGSCYGVPTVGNDWGDCDPANPKNNRTVASVLIESETSKVLIDMSPDFRQQSCRHNLTDLDAIIFTHGHSDHILGNFWLPRLMQYYKGKDVPLYADKPTQEDIERAFWFQMKGNGNVQYSYGGTTHWETIEPFKEIVIGDITLLPLPQMHGRMTSYGFRIGDFAYSTDFNDMPPDSWERLQGLNCWLVECNRKDKSANSEQHLYVEKVLHMIDTIKPDKAFLTHMGVTMDYDAMNTALPPHVRMAYDGLSFEIG